MTGDFLTPVGVEFKLRPRRMRSMAPRPYFPIYVAERLGIRVARFNGWEDRPLVLSRVGGDGPEDSFCHVVKRKVWIPEFHRSGKPRGYGGDVETDLHEIMHVLCHPPCCKNIEEVDEGWLLMAVEREYGRLGGKAVLGRVVAWQNATITNFDDRTAQGARRAWWKAALDRARRLGMLDAQNKPTFQWPNWRLLTKSDRQLMQGPKD